MKRLVSKAPPEGTRAPAYPSWTALRGSPTPFDPSRRRFLRQVGTAAGALSVLSTTGLPRLAHAQQPTPNFGLLDQHPPSGALVAPAQPMAMMPAVPPPAPVQGLAQPPTTPAAIEPPTSGPTSQATAEWVTEDRALWVEPGYLILVRWSRPIDNLDVVAALEGATPTVAAYLSSNVTAYNDLHDLDRLHTLEAGLVSMLAPTLSPATLDVLHLDHDCNTVCTGLPGYYDAPENIPLPGMLPAPSMR
jgi:hypothetical protein